MTPSRSALSAPVAPGACRTPVVRALTRGEMDGQHWRERTGVIEPALLRGRDFVLDPDVVAVAVLSDDLVSRFRDASQQLLAELDRASATMVVLVPWTTPPATGTRYDGVVDSFVCDAKTFESICRQGAAPPEGLCFSLLRALLNREIGVGRLVVRQLPDPQPSCAQPLTHTATLVMSHRGDPEHLSTALRSIETADQGECIRPFVGLDVDDPQPYERLRERHSDTRFFTVAPQRAGLFVMRQRLLEQADERFFCLQDSDDVSCSDRFTAQFAALAGAGCELLGCHELRVDEINHTVEAWRLPLNVQEALQAGYSDAFLNGTAVGLRGSLLAAGGYSTNYPIANDTQFMLRAFFSVSMRNIDGFYYIRRRHPTALTVARATAFGTPLRERLRTTWANDFDAVRRGQLRLADSSLRPMHTDVPYVVAPWRPEPDGAGTQGLSTASVASRETAAGLNA